MKPQKEPNKGRQKNEKYTPINKSVSLILVQVPSTRICMIVTSLSQLLH